MQTQVEPSGTAPRATRDSILTAELQKLQKYKARLKGENERYAEDHPELRPLLDEFLAAVIRDKPSDIVKFGCLYFNSLRASTSVGPSPLVITGPPVIGKTMFIRMLTERYPKAFGTPIVHTTRVRREGEVNGVDQWFIDKPKFDEMNSNNEFCDFYVMHTNYFATSIKAVSEVRAQGKICILDVSMEGIRKIKASDLECKYLFISPQSIEAYDSFLRKRGQDTEEKLLQKVAQCTTEMAAANVHGAFDYVLVNGDKDLAFEELIYTLQGWYPEIEDAGSVASSLK